MGLLEQFDKWLRGPIRVPLEEELRLQLAELYVDLIIPPSLRAKGLETTSFWTLEKVQAEIASFIARKQRLDSALERLEDRQRPLAIIADHVTGLRQYDELVVRQDID